MNIFKVLVVISLLFDALLAIDINSNFFKGYTIETKRCNYLIKTKIYEDCYSSKRKEPAFVIYAIPGYKPGKRYGRPDFYEDTKLPKKYRSEPEDYLGSHEDRGHNCPNGIFSNNQKLQYLTFDMINIAPQAPMLNRKYWNSVEKFARNQKRHCKEVYVITGNCGSKGKLKGGEVIPKYWFKIIYLKDQNKIYAILAPNINKGMANAKLLRYFTTVENIERKCGIKLIKKIIKKD